VSLRCNTKTIFRKNLLFNSDSTRPPEAIDRKTLVALALMTMAMITTVAAYVPGLSGPLFLDDLPQLQELIENSADNPERLFDRHIVSSSGPFGRSVAMATFVGSAVAHGPDTWWWKYENLMLHLITGLLVFWLTALLFQVGSENRTDRHWLVAAVVATGWLLHPLQVSTVLYTVQRMTELSTLFMFAGLICYAKGRQRQIDGDKNGWIFIAVGFAVFLPLALFSKETALLFPVFCTLMEFLIFHFKSAAFSQKQIKLFRSMTLAVYLVGTIIVIANFSTLVLRAYEFRDFTFGDRIFTEMRIVALYLYQLLIPIQSKMGFYHDDIVLSTSLLSPLSTLFSAVFLSALIGSAVYFRKRLPLYAFGILFFFVGHLLESSIFALELMFEHRNYLPSAGIVIAVVAVVQAAMQKQQQTILIAAIAITALSLLTWQRAVTWGSPDTMYAYMYRAHPQSKRLSYIFADSSTRMRNYPNARKVLSSMETSLGTATHGLLLDCLEHGEVKDSRVEELLAFADGRVDGHATISIDDLVQASLDEKCDVPQVLLIELMDHLLAFPAESFLHKQSILTAKAHLLESLDDVDGAVSALRTAYELQPDNSRSLYFIAHALSTADRLEEASNALTAAYELEKTSPIQNKNIAKTIYLNIGGMYTADNEFEKALTIYAQGISSIPTEALFYLRKTELYIQLQRYDRARETLLELRTLDAYDVSEHEYAIRRLGAAIRPGTDATGA